MTVRDDGLAGRKVAPRTVAYFATSLALQSVVARATSDTDEFKLIWSSTSVVELVRAQALKAADILVVEVEPLGIRIWNVLHELHTLAPQGISLLVGQPDDVARLSDAVSWGVRGVVLPTRAEGELPRAMTALSSGQVWFSRTLASSLIARREVEPTEPATDTSGDTWRQLPALTERELAVLHEVLQGHTNKEIARLLAISQQIVKIHMQNIFHKLRVHRRIDLMLLHGATPTGRR